MAFTTNLNLKNFSLNKSIPGYICATARHKAPTPAPILAFFDFFVNKELIKILIQNLGLKKRIFVLQ